jgi:small conductance mechanosensitive channel
LATNPGLIPFFPVSVKVKILESLNNLFGDVSQISQVIMINWITVFQLIIMILTLIVIRDIIDCILKNVKAKTKRAKTFVGLYINLSKYFFTIIGVIWSLNIIGISSGTIFAGVSIVAMVISFSAESLISDVVTGVFLLFDNVYNVDDIIEVDGYRGTVTKIGIRTTSIQDTAGNEKILNNSDIRNIINRSNKLSVAICDIQIDNKVEMSTIDKAFKEATNQIVANYKSDISHIKYKGIQSIEKDCITVRLQGNVLEKYIYEAQRYMYREIKIALEKNGIYDEKR